MNKIIIYGSKYGTTEQYAKELSNRLNIEAIEYENWLICRWRFRYV